MSDTPTPLAVGFIGLGKMGWPMAARLVTAQYQVRVLDSRAEVASSFVREVGGVAVASLDDLAKTSDVIITMLPNSKIVTSVVDELRLSLRRGTTLLEMSPGLPSATVRLAELLSDSGIELVDAPVSGGVARAQAGELTIMVGGDTASIERCRPILDKMGTSIVHTGKVGSAQATKALNNLVSAAGLLISVEALAIGQRFGLAPEVMVDVLNSSSGQNNSTLKKIKPFVLSRSFGSGFALDLMVKDLSTAMAIARDADAVTPFAASCAQLWSSAARLLDPLADHTEIARFVESLNATTLESVKH